jgi:signal transduction histidine kinase
LRDLLSLKLQDNRNGAWMRWKFEPSLLNIFRLFVTLRIAFLTFSTIRYSSWFGNRLIIISFFTIGASVLLLIYLYSAHLQKWMPKAYLPIALIIATLLIVLEGRLVQWIILNTDFPANLPDPLEANLRPLMDNLAFPMLFTLSNASSLFVPLVFISWQYNFRSVLLFIVLTTALELGLLLRLREATSPEFSLETFAIFTRSGAFFIVGYIVSQLTAIQRKQHDDLRGSHRQLALYAATQEKLLVSQERNRLARELHDTLAHTMSAVTIKLNATHLIWERDNERAKTMLSEVIASMNEGNVEIRRALRDLRATPLDEMGLVLAVRHLAEAAAQRASLTLDLNTPNHELHFAPDIELGIYRIAQEALTNAVEHADASEIRLSMQTQDNRFVLEVVDNGTGFEVKDAENSGRLGLLGMKERAAMLGGKLSIESANKKGCRIEFVLEML